MEAKTCLITGGAGFIGNCFVREMLENHKDMQLVVLDVLSYAGNLENLKDLLSNPRLVFVKGSISDRALVESLFEKYHPSFVVNFAAETHVDRSIEDPDAFLETNVKGTQILLEAAKKYWTCGKDSQGYPCWMDGVRFLQVSTDEVYGSLGPEGFFTEESPIKPRSPYSAAKAAADHFVMAYHHTFKMPVNITRCSNNYGGYQFPEKLIPLVIHNILQGKKLPVYGKGDQVRDWLFVEDHCRAIDLVLTKARSGEIYNVGGHNEMQNIQIIKIILNTVRRLVIENPEYESAFCHIEKDSEGKIDFSWINEGLITYVRDRLGHDSRYAIDPAKIQRDLGWLPNTCFDKGIVNTVRWYLEHCDWVNSVCSGAYLQYYDKMYTNR